MLPKPLERLKEFLEKDKGFKFTEQVDSFNFGNRIILFKSPSLRFRVICDRDFWSIDVCGNRLKEDWYDIVLICLLVDDGLDVANSLGGQVDFILRKWDVVTTLFIEKNQKKTIEAIMKLKNERDKLLSPDFFGK